MDEKQEKLNLIETLWNLRVLNWSEYVLAKAELNGMSKEGLEWMAERIKKAGVS